MRVSVLAALALLAVAAMPAPAHAQAHASRQPAPGVRATAPHGSRPAGGIRQGRPGANRPAGNRTTPLPPLTAALDLGQLGYVLLPPAPDPQTATARQLGRLRRLFPADPARVDLLERQLDDALATRGGLDLDAIRARHPGRPIIAIQLNRMDQIAGTKQELRSARRLAARVKRAGGVPVFLPPAVALGHEARRQITASADAILLGGGDDIDPALYGEAIAGARDTNRRRDVPELRLVDAAIAAGVPVRGICRGCQMIAVATGGALEQDIDQPGHGPVAPEQHTIVTSLASRARRLFGPATGGVTSRHHQAVKRTGPGVAISGRAPDGTAEVVEGAGVLGVQFHPEIPADRAVTAAFFDDLIESARAHRAARGR